MMSSTNNLLTRRSREIITIVLITMEEGTETNTTKEADTNIKTIKRTIKEIIILTVRISIQVARKAVTDPKGILRAIIGTMSQEIIIIIRTMVKEMITTILVEARKEKIVEDIKTTTEQKTPVEGLIMQASETVVTITTTGLIVRILQ